MIPLYIRRIDQILGWAESNDVDVLVDFHQDNFANISHFYMQESCGQCTPCREGTGWLYRVLKRIVNGQGRPEDIDLLDGVANKIGGRTICALGDAAAMPVMSFVKHFREEFVAYLP